MKTRFFNVMSEKETTTEFHKATSAIKSITCMHQQHKGMTSTLAEQSISNRHKHQQTHIDVTQHPPTLAHVEIETLGKPYAPGVLCLESENHRSPGYEVHYSEAEIPKKPNHAHL